MTTEIKLISRDQAIRLISTNKEIKLNPIQAEGWRRCLRNSSAIWVGYYAEKLVCIFGLIPPSLADGGRAYLWLHTTDEVQGHEFVFVRRSQIAIKQMLETWPVIHGHCERTADRSRRWVKWLGATFGEPEGTLIPFQIVRANG